MSSTIRSPSADYKSLQGKKKKASFECQSCTRKFATRSHLVRHSRVHTGERRYACDYPGCEMRCSRKDNLQQHYRTHLVVNPRRANASQSMLTAAQEYEPNATETSPERAENNAFTAQDVKPIQSRTALPETEASVNVSIMPSGAVVNTVNGLSAAHEREDPDREWSVSPPPPLSSAYDYWYAHGCLPHTVRNPASVSGSGSSGATSPEMSNALELAPGQRNYVDSPTTYYHPNSHISNATTYPSYTEGEGQTGPSAVRPSFPLGNNPFPPVADYQHHPSHSHHHHQRSHSHSYSMGSYSRIGYESATASPQLPSAPSHAAAATSGAQIQGQARHYSTDSFDQAPFHRTLGTFNSAGASPSGPPEGTFHAPHSASHSHPNYTRHHSLNEGPFHPMPETGVDSRPVTRHGSMGASQHYSMPVFPSHPHTQMPFGVPVDMSHGHPHGGHAPFGESPVSRSSIPMGVPGSPRGRPSPTHSHSHSASSLVLPPIRYAGGHEIPAGPVGGISAGLSLGSYGGMNVGGHAPFGSGNSWDRMNISDARALPAVAAAPGHSSLGNEMPR